jgi:hypothetical protein
MRDVVTGSCGGDAVSLVRAFAQRLGATVVVTTAKVGEVV